MKVIMKESAGVFYQAAASTNKRASFTHLIFLYSFVRSLLLKLSSLRQSIKSGKSP